MIREAASLCFAPVVLMGYLFASDFRTNVSKPTEDKAGDGAMIEVQTCEKGWGLDAKASTNGLLGADVQYGFVYQIDSKWKLVGTPKLGVSHTTQPLKELSQTTQFGLGGQVMLGYEQYRVGAELWHLSNGDQTLPNIGLNMIAIQAGYAF